jgi:nicotinate-nucleotide--dimethylbenzimidazole phosphoribosyltransferase
MTTEVTDTLQQQLQDIIDNKTKPPGSLGALETLAIQIGLIQNTTTPAVDRPAAFIFGADHGVCAEGVNPFPQVVTEQMLANFAAGGAAMSVFCRTNDIPLTIVNMGIVDEDARWPGVLHCPVAAGTQNLRHQAAMTAEQCQQAIQCGQQLAEQAVRDGHNILLIGEMGIGNTTSASALLSALTGLPPSQTVGPGTGANAEQQALKVRVIEEALTRLSDASAQEILAEVGGFEIAAMTGVLLAAKSLNTPVLVDGFIASVAALCAERIAPGSKANWVFAHQSAEPAHRHMLEALSATPLLNLGLRLGEGSGAALAYPLVKNAVAMLNDMASFADAGISA